MKKEMKNPVKDEKTDEDGDVSERVFFGGCYNRFSKYVRLLSRDVTEPIDYYPTVGFRIVRNKT